MSWFQKCFIFLVLLRCNLDGAALHFHLKTIRRVQKVASPVRSQEPTYELSPRKQWKTTIFIVFSAPLVSLGQEHQCFLQCLLSLGQDNHLFTVFSAPRVSLGQENQCFYCVCLSLGQENHCFFTAFSAPLVSLGQENQCFYCVFFELRPRQPLFLLCFRHHE